MNLTPSFSQDYSSNIRGFAWVLRNATLANVKGGRPTEIKRVIPSDLPGI
jgi:hypothetical protein